MLGGRALVLSGSALPPEYRINDYFLAGLFGPMLLPLTLTLSASTLKVSINISLD
jgi:hypothetical protein